MITATVEVCAASCLVVPEKNTVTMHMRSPSVKADVFEVKTAGQRYERIEYFVYLGGTINIISDVTPGVNRRICQAWRSFVKYSKAIYGNPCIALTEKVRFPKAEMIEVTLYGCMTWMLSPKYFGPLWEAHRGFPLRCLDENTLTHSAPDYHMMPYREVLERAGCDCIKDAVVR